VLEKVTDEPAVGRLLAEERAEAKRVEQPPAKGVEEVGDEGLAGREAVEDRRAEEGVADEENEREVGRPEEVEVLKDDGVLLEVARRHVRRERAGRGRGRARGRVAAAAGAAVDQAGRCRADRHAPGEGLLATAVDAVDV
jgi:hypothetical protein